MTVVLVAMSLLSLTVVLFKSVELELEWDRDNRRAGVALAQWGAGARSLARYDRGLPT